jgi:signal transduction histidine kinase
MFKRFSLIYFLLAVATIALAVSLFLSLNVLSNELIKQQHKYRESLVWSVSQLEREGMVFLQQLLLFGNGDSLVDGQAVQQAFDIFWSRTETTRQGQAGKLALQLSRSDNAESFFHQIQNTLEYCDPLIVRIVAGERDLVQSVYTTFQPLMVPIHRLVQEMGNAAMQAQQDDRQGFLSLKQKAVWLLLASFCSGSLLAILLLTRQRALTRLHNSLEYQVVQRTEELSQANLALNDEVLKHRYAQEEMRGLRNLLENIVRLMPSQLVGIDNLGIVMLWNRQMEDATGISTEDALGAPLEQSLPEIRAWLGDSRDRLSRGETVVAHKHPCLEKSPETLIDIIAYPLSAGGQGGVVIRIDDVTDRAKMDEHMIQSEKMISIGGLVAGMAHEINNPLAGIIQNLQVIEQRIDRNFETNKKAASKCGISMEEIHQYFDDRKLPKLFDGVRESTQKAVKIVNNLQYFTRRGGGGFQFCSLLDLLDSSWDLVRNDSSLNLNSSVSRISVVREYEEKLPEIECQSNQLQQVFFNILKNAVQAITAGPSKNSHPQITMRVSSDKESVLIEIQDNGAGMEEAVRKRVFEPFFTTMEVGSGPGLGLSVAYMIICDKHGGSMDVESTVGRGSRFIISLPWFQIKDVAGV